MRRAPHELGSAADLYKVLRKAIDELDLPKVDQCRMESIDDSCVCEVLGENGEEFVDVFTGEIGILTPEFVQFVRKRYFRNLWFDCTVRIFGEGDFVAIRKEGLFWGSEKIAPDLIDCKLREFREATSLAREDHIGPMRRQLHFLAGKVPDAVHSWRDTSAGVFLAAFDRRNARMNESIWMLYRGDEHSLSVIEHDATGRPPAKDSPYPITCQGDLGVQYQSSPCDYYLVCWVFDDIADHTIEIVRRDTKQNIVAVDTVTIKLEDVIRDTDLQELERSILSRRMAR